MFTLTVALIKIGVKGKALKFIDNGKFIKTVPQTKLALANHSFSHHFIGYCNTEKGDKTKCRCSFCRSEKKTVLVRAIKLSSCSSG